MRIWKAFFSLFCHPIILTSSNLFVSIVDCDSQSLFFLFISSGTKHNCLVSFFSIHIYYDYDYIFQVERMRGDFLCDNHVAAHSHLCVLFALLLCWWYFFFHPLCCCLRSLVVANTAYFLAEKNKNFLVVVKAFATFHVESVKLFLSLTMLNILWISSCLRTWIV